MYYSNRYGIDLALLVVRVVVGIIFFVHGGQKALGWWGGPGPAGIIEMTGGMGFQPAALWGWLLIIAEFGGGIGLLLGLFSPLWAIGIIITMLVAIVKVHGPNGFMLSEQGFEYNFALIGLALPVLLAGPGRYSLDYLLFGARREKLSAEPA